MNKEIKNKQEELKSWIKKIGMTQKYFAEQYFIEVYGSYEESEIQGFYEKFKGHLKRNTTPVETIDIYLNYLYQMEEFKKVGYIKPVYLEDDMFDKEFNKRMNEISKCITDKLIENSSE